MRIFTNGQHKPSHIEPFKALLGLPPRGAFYLGTPLCGKNIESSRAVVLSSADAEDAVELTTSVSTLSWTINFRWRRRCCAGVRGHGDYQWTGSGGDRENR